MVTKAGGVRPRFQERKLTAWRTEIERQTRETVVDAILADLDADAEITATSNWTAIRDGVNNRRNLD